jgi:acyl-CoA thioesterase-1
MVRLPSGLLTFLLIVCAARTALSSELLDMRRFLVLFALLTITGGHAADVPTVLIFGDSLSAGYGIDVDQSWAALLQSRLREQGYEHRVVNASISGETTEGGAERIGPALANFSPELIILELGGNDGLRGFPPQRMRQNLEKIILTSKDSGAEVVLLGIRIPSNYGPRYTQAFEDVFRETAETFEVPWIEFFMDGIALNEELMQADGIHPNAKAQPRLLDNAWPVIREALGPAN